MSEYNYWNGSEWVEANPNRMFRLEDIRKAFYKEFQGSGELWFGRTTEEYGPSSGYVDPYFSEFLQYLVEGGEEQP